MQEKLFPVGGLIMPSLIIFKEDTRVEFPITIVWVNA
jgi:hypothetical protein